MSGHSEPVSDTAEISERYTLSLECKEGLAASLEEQRHRLRYVLAFATRETVTLSPLPCWKHLAHAIYKQRVAKLVTTLETGAVALPGNHLLRYA
jgi:hypothetical protein